MGDCGVCIGGGDWDGYPEFQTTEEVKARKDHRCIECREPILKGQTYQRHSGKFDGDIFCDKRCLMCAEILAGFNCDGGALDDDLWTDMHQNVFPVMTTACLDRLSTPEAKRFLLDRWRKWKFQDVS